MLSTVRGTDSIVTPQAAVPTTKPMGEIDDQSYMIDHCQCFMKKIAINLALQPSTGSSSLPATFISLISFYDSTEEQ